METKSNLPSDGTVPTKDVRRDPTELPPEVAHPDYYTRGRIEVIDFIEDQELPFHLGNAVKYIARAGYKTPEKEVEDLQKAVWYIQRYMQYVQDLVPNIISEEPRRL